MTNCYNLIDWKPEVKVLEWLSNFVKDIEIATKIFFVRSIGNKEEIKYTSSSAYKEIISMKLLFMNH